MDSLFIFFSGSRDRESVEHHLVYSFSLLALACRHSIEVDIFLYLDYVSSDEKPAFLTLQKIRQNPRFIAPFVESSFEQFLHLVSWSCILRLAIIFSFIENQLEEKAQQLPRLFLSRVCKGCETNIVEISKLLEIFDKFLARLKAVRCLRQVLLLQESKIYELISSICALRMKSYEATDDSATQSLGCEFVQAFHVHSKGLKLHQKKVVSVFHI